MLALFCSLVSRSTFRSPERYLLCNASFQSDFNQLSYAQGSPQVLIRATSAAFSDKQSHLSTSAFLADRKVAKCAAFEEPAAATFPCSEFYSKPQIPTRYSAESQERVLLNLAMVPFLPRGATCRLSPSLPPPSQAPWNGALFNSWLRWICALISQDITALMMRSIFHLITDGLPNWSDQNPGCSC